MTSSRAFLRLTCGLAVAAFAIAIATTRSPTSPVSRILPVGTSPARAVDQLSPFADCEELRQWYVRQTLPHVTAWGLEFGYPEMFMFDGAAVRADASATAPEVGSSPTGTNVQEAGVEEADSAKTYRDDFVVSVHRQALVVTDVSGAAPRVVGRVQLAGSAESSELLIVGNRAIVLGRGWPGDTIGGRLAYWRASQGRTAMTTVDLADPAQPRVIDRQEFTGDLSAARAHDATIRLVLTQATVDLPFVQPGRELSRQAARQQNREIVRFAALDAWLPQYVDEQGNKTSPLLDCADVQHPRTGSGLGTITVLTVDPASGEVEKDAVTADGSLVYVSIDRLYVATVDDGWLEWGDQPGAGKTSSTVHAFALDAGDTAYVASGEVDGVIPDRWALSEHEGLLRVASTRGPRWNPTQTAVTVLREGSGQLTAIGEVDGLGKREEITAVRWFGDLAVVVTFRQTDPLYTVDLSDPTAPRVLGELKITGFSSYLHPVGGDVILGIGQSATRSGRTRGSQISTFDLSTTSRIQKLDLAASYSPVEDDARAFTYLPDSKSPSSPSRAGARTRLG